MKYIPYKLEEEPGSAFRYYSLAALFTFLDLMSMWSLLKVFFSNPGYVSDYFKSIQIGGSSSTLPNRTNTPRVIVDVDDENATPAVGGA